MKNQTKKVLLGAATVAALGGAVAGDAKAATTAAIGIDAVIAAPISIATAGQNLDFGTVTEQGAGTLKVGPNSATTPGASITVIGGTPAAGSFVVKGQASIGYSITFATSAVMKHAVTPTKTMVVNAFSIGKSTVATGVVSPFTSTFPAGAGQQTVNNLRLGGTLNIGAGQTTGVYTGSVTLTAAYN